VALVALIVIGPERLPKIARTMGHLAGRMQRYVSALKADVERELRMDELNKVKQEAERSIRDAHVQVSSEVGQIEQHVHDAAEQKEPRA